MSDRRDPKVADRRQLLPRDGGRRKTDVKVKATVSVATCVLFFSDMDVTCWLCGTFVPAGTRHRCERKP